MGNGVLESTLCLAELHIAATPYPHASHANCSVRLMISVGDGDTEGKVVLYPEEPDQGVPLDVAIPR